MSRDLFDGAAARFPVGAAGDAADVRQVRQRLQSRRRPGRGRRARPPAGVRGGEGQREGAQQRGLAGLRAADDGGVAAGPGQVQLPLALPLLGRVVEQPERDVQRADSAAGELGARRQAQRAPGPRPGPGSSACGSGGSQIGAVTRGKSLIVSTSADITVGPVARSVGCR